MNFTCMTGMKVCIEMNKLKLAGVADVFHHEVDGEEGVTAIGVKFGDAFSNCIVR